MGGTVGCGCGLVCCGGAGVGVAVVVSEGLGFGTAGLDGGGALGLYLFVICSRSSCCTLQTPLHLASNLPTLVSSFL